MNQSPGSYGRWRAAEDDGRDDDADWAFRAVFQSAMPEQPVSHDFTTRTMTAVSAAAAGDARRARRTRAGVSMGTLVATSAAVYLGAGWAVSLASAALVGLLNMVIAGAVRGASALTPGGFWPVLASLGRAAAALAAEPTVTLAMIAISGVAIAALLALQRLLGSDGESFQ